MKIRAGCTRIVFVFRGFVVKIPNFVYCQRHFLLGCHANLSERNLWKQWNCKSQMIVPSLYCSWLGILQVQKRAEILSNDVWLTEQEQERFKEITSDIKPSNFGIYEGRLVCVDYA